MGIKENVFLKSANTKNAAKKTHKIVKNKFARKIEKQNIVRKINDKS